MLKRYNQVEYGLSHDFTNSMWRLGRKGISWEKECHDKPEIADQTKSNLLVVCAITSADSRLLGALHITVLLAGDGGCGGWFVMKEWMKRITFVGSARETVAYLFRGSVNFKLYFFYFIFHVLWIEWFLRREGRNEHSCFNNCLPNSKKKLKCKHLWEQGGILVFLGPYAACVFCV